MSFSNEFLNLLNEIKEFHDTKRYLWYRGHNNSNYKLNSGLYRVELSNKNSYLATEKTYYNYFKRMGNMLHDQKDWDLLFVMQHFGVRTRLLDWTESLPVALYFAIEGWDYINSTCCLWMLDPIKLNYFGINDEIFYTPSNSYEEHLRKWPNFNENSLAMYPMRNNTRINAQHGMFTLQGNLAIPLEEEYEGKLLKEGVLKKIEITSEIKDDIKLYLKQCGIHEFSLYQDLGGLADYINKLGYFKERNEKEVVAHFPD